jgi:phage/plasmid-associated DNA primase
MAGTDANNATLNLGLVGTPATTVNNEVNSYEENHAYSESIIDAKINNEYNVAFRNFETFLRDQYNYKTATKVAKTNVINQESKQTWALPDDVFATLMYHVEECRKSGCTLHMSEKQQYEGGLLESGIMLDFDCKYKVCNLEIKKTTKSKLIEAIMELIVNSLDYTGVTSPETTKVGIIERPKSSLIDNEKLYKKGFHILIPGVRLTRPHKKYLVAEIKSSQKVVTILREMGVVNAESACDTGSASVPVYFIGSCKMSGGLKYELTNVYDIELTPGYIRAQEIHDPIKSLAKYNLAYEFCLTHEAKYPDGLISLIRKKVYKPILDLESKISNYYDRTSNGIIPESEILDTDSKVNILVRASPDALYVQGLLSILGTEYATEYNLWRNVVYALANSSNGRINYFDLAEWFSQKCPEKYSAASLKELWDDARVRSVTGMTKNSKGLTIRSLEYWARQCDQNQYFQRIRENYFHKLLNYAYEFQGSIENSMISDLLHSMLKNKFTFDYEGKTGVWFEFVVPEDPQYTVGEIWKWRKEPANPISIQQYMTDKLPAIFNEVTQRFVDKRNAAAADKAKSKRFAEIIKSLGKSKLKLFNNVFKERTIKECTNWFINRGFIKKLDESCPNILGVGNGLLEMGRTVQFIDHYHEYPISKYTVVPWHGKLNPEQPNAFQLKLLEMIGDIIIENDARIKLMMFFSTALVGGVKNLPLLLGTGGGSNGKTVLMTLMIETLGKDVYASLVNPKTYCTEPESADRPNSSIMQFKGKRFTVGEETNKGDQVNPAAVKMLNKSAGTSAREMFGKQESFQVSATQVTTSQHDFIVLTTDHGFWRRIMAYIFRTKFCSKPNADNPFEVADDPKCREMASDKNYQIAWLQILVYFYEWFQEVYDGNYDNVPSPTIDMQTEHFRNSMDKINQFIYRFVVISPKYSTEGSDASLENIALKFLKWHDVNYGTKKQTLSEVVKDFENSAILKHLRRNRQGMYETFGIRILEEKEFIRDSETYFKPRTEGYRPIKDPIAFWWRRSDLKTAETKNTIETKIVLPIMRSEKSLIAAEHGNDKDFVDIKKKVIEPDNKKQESLVVESGGFSWEELMGGT